MSSRSVIAVNLRVLRELRDRMGQLELAERVGVSRRTIARLENAEVADPGIDQVRALAAALGVTLRMLSEQRLVGLSLPLPEDVRARLCSGEGPALLERIIHLIRTTPPLEGEPPVARREA
ncbi:MAG: helix-turn-helix domain-containing protein [Myxococcales bacterium]|nr:helix-turn-helix domain-containing protein [Myxococcales bacterium]